jgi:hypothetical protein
MIGGVKNLFEKYEQETRQELWMKREELIQNIQNPGVVDSYISGELGYNLLFVHKAIAMNRFVTELKKFAKLTLEKLLSENQNDTQENLDFLDDALNYDAACISNIFENLEQTPQITLYYDIPKFITQKNIAISKLHLKNTTTVNFTLDDEQLDIIKRSLQLYTSSDLGVSRILTKVFVKKILRTSMLDNTSSRKSEEITNSVDWPYL